MPDDDAGLLCHTDIQGSAAHRNGEVAVGQSCCVISDPHVVAADLLSCGVILPGSYGVLPWRNSTVAVAWVHCNVHFGGLGA